MNAQEAVKQFVVLVYRLRSWRGSWVEAEGWW